MPLLDHFRPPLIRLRKWEGMHSASANAMVQQLSRELPEGYFCEPEITLGGAQVEVDVGTWEEKHGSSPNGRTGTAVATWTAPMPALAAAIDFLKPDVFEVKVYHESGGAQLVAAIELVSPGNKDRPEQRRAFTTKCASYLQKWCFRHRDRRGDFTEG